MDLMRIKKKLEQKKLEQAKLQGQQETMRKELKEKFGIDTKDEVEDLLKKYTEELKEKQKEYDTMLKVFKENYGEL